MLLLDERGGKIRERAVGLRAIFLAARRRAAIEHFLEQHDQISVLLQFRRDPTGRRKRKCLRVGEVPVERVLAEFGWVEQDVALLASGMPPRHRNTRQESRAQRY